MPFPPALWSALQVANNYYRPDLKKAALARLSVVNRSLRVAKSGVKKRNRQAVKVPILHYYHPFPPELKVRFSCFVWRGNYCVFNIQQLELCYSFQLSWFFFSRDGLSKKDECSYYRISSEKEGGIATTRHKFYSLNRKGSKIVLV